ncbi:Pentapeptide repeat-containing protein [Paracoccus halophilus]|uniref:Pentapeptide repeat-containing protein n=1 Tax=Paracoccus halophilus TaxID=376733 RepID=A0A099F045_9RHOB|nr:pentapeptide repeat-containing protein [Paracoccus halophilus]KGJ04035.1 pentapeptide repeat-containing protein [Paracoccus halophilus]SFA44333.1 Pentapeptide repeat-containing protein [Paracoccus halophilus]
MAEFTRTELIRKIATTGRLQLAGTDLAGLDLSNLTLVGADFSYADLTGADLSGAQLSGASLWSCRAAGARFSGANLTGASLGLADLTGADMREALLERADLTGARLNGADLTDARLRGAWLDAMQRALAIGAPPLRYPARSGPGVRVVDEDHLAEPVALRCGDRLEIHFSGSRDAADARVAQHGADGAAILAPVDPAGPARGPFHVLAFEAVVAGRAQLVIEHRDGRDPETLEVLVTP